MSALKIVAVAIAFLAIGVEALSLNDIWARPSNPSGEPSFCGSHECPAYTVLNKTDVYELRAYKPSSWAFTYVRSTSLKDIGKHGIKPLWQYIGGNNFRGVTIDKTVPDVFRFSYDGPSINRRSVMIYLPEKYAPFPTPYDQGVQIFHTDENKLFYVMSFSDHIHNMEQLDGKVNKLWAALKKDGVSFADYKYYAAKYNEDHREVWVPKV